MFIASPASAKYSSYFIPWQEIEETLDRMKSQGYSALVNVGVQGVNLALQGAITVSVNSALTALLMIHMGGFEVLSTPPLDTEPNRFLLSAKGCDEP